MTSGSAGSCCTCQTPLGGSHGGGGRGCRGAQAGGINVPPYQGTSIPMVKYMKTIQIPHLIKHSVAQL